MLTYMQRRTVKLPDESDARLRHEAIEKFLRVDSGRRRLLATGAGASGRDDIAECIEEIIGTSML
jgi:hypothetical protein